MNSGCYRVIFNKARGMLMVVSEAACSQGKTGNPANSGSEISQVAGASQTAAQTNSTYQGGQLVALRSHVLLALGLATIVASSVSISNSAYADATSIVADRNAAANQQATILKSSNGTTQVNIQAPSVAGVSRNVFSQFDVGADGAIINNSRTNAQTQLAGWVEGNPYLARGEARVILNEVNSSDPSRLSGYTEIAGGRAELVIANPAGISCASCGFINASRTTLTTGNALMDQGKLTGFDVTGGKVRIDGDGLDTSGSDYTQILARTSEINAAVYAKNLDVIIGSNKVSYEADAQDTVITSANSNASNTTTGVALDVSALGAMYAGKIRLIGTDKGMGVTNAGSIIASSGGLQLDNDGNLINSGSLIANQGKVDIATKGFSVDNSGTIASSRDTIALDSIALNNSGVISSYDALTLKQTGTINNSGEIVTGSFNVKAAALNNTGTLLQTGKGKLAIDTQFFVNQQQAIVGQDLYITDTTTPPTVTPSKKPPTTATNGSSVNTDDGTTQSPEPNPTPLPMITRDGNISVNSLTNTGSTGVIYTNAAINIAADSVVNKDKSSLAVNNIVITTNGSVANNNSRLQLDEINWQLADFDNNKGQLLVIKGISITSADKINNTQGSIAAVGDINLSAQNKFINNKGSVQSNATIVTRSSELDNTQGTLSSQGNLSIDSDGILTNNKGRIQTDQNLQINAKGYTNTDGTIIGVKRANIDVFDDINIDNSSDNIQADNLTLSTQGRFSNTGKLSGQNALTINAQRIDNQKGAELISNGNTALNATTDINNRGLINGVNTYLKADKSVNNYSNGRIYGDHVAIAATTLNNTPDGDNINAASNSAPIIAARERLDIGVTTLNNNPNQARAGKFNEDFNGQARLLSNGELHIGGSLDANQQAIGRATTVTNKGASIESIGDMSISTDTLNNVNADFETQEFTIEENKGKQQFADGRDGKKYDRSEVEFRDDKKLKNEDLYIIATNTPLGDSGGEDFWRFDFDERITEDRTVVSDPSRIIAGGVISLQGNNLNNDKSQLGLGEGFVVIGDTVKNVGESDLQGFKTRYVENGKVIYRHVEPSGLTGSKHKIEEDDKGTYVQTPEKLESYQLPILKQDIDKVVIAHDVTDTGSQQIDKGATDEIRSSDSVPTLPNSSLYGVNPDSNAEYLIETDPAFANYKNWLSSSYMLDRLKLDPNITQKRLGDGYYEQQYIRDQIMMLTGRYYLGDYRNQDAQYQGLMDAGVTTAQTLNLRPGIALTDAQIATLTTDIVWLVQQNITLADGSIQKVLVPKVYTRQAVGQIDGTGNLIAADYLDMQLTGDLNNKGNIVGHQSVKINTTNLTNQNGGLIKGDFVQIATKKDLNNLGGNLSADSAMQLDVGGNFNNKSLTYSTESVKGASNATRTGIAQIASIYVGDGLKGQTDENGNALTTFIANVGGDTSFAAGRLDNLGGSSFINTTGDVKLDAVNVGYQSNSIGDANNYFNEGASADIGSQLNGNNDIIVKGNNVSSIATQISSNQGTVGIIADGNIDFKEGRSKQNLSTASTSKERNWYGSKRISENNDFYGDTTLASNITGKDIFIDSKNGNINLIGTNVSAEKAAEMTAMKGKVTVQSTVDKEKRSYQKSTDNFYKETGHQQGYERETLNETGISANNIYINGKDVAINGASLQARDGSLQIGDATLVSDSKGNLKLDENGKPIVQSGSIDNLSFGTITLNSREWDEQQKSYKGIAKAAMQVAGVVGGALGITDGVTISESKGYTTSTTGGAVSRLEGSNIAVGANKITAIGTEFTATQKGGSTYVLGNDINFGVATSNTKTTENVQKETIGGEGIKLNSDSLQLGAIVRTDSEDTKTTTTGTNKGVTIDSDNITVLGNMTDDSLTTTAAKFNANQETGSLLIGAKTTTLGGIENTESVTHTNKTDTTRVSVDVHHASVDTISAAEKVKEAGSALAAAKNALSDAKDRSSRGELSQNAVKDYEINLAAATLNLANAQINLGSTAQGAANTAGTLGFSATGNAENTQTTSTDTQTQGQWQGTELNGANATFVGDDFTGVGLKGNIRQLNIDNLSSLNLKAGTNTSNSSSNSKTDSQTGSISTTGSASLGISTQQSQSQSQENTYTNSELNVEEFNGYAGTTNLTGGSINAGGGNYATDNLTIETVQNTASSSNSSSGSNLGINFNSGLPSGGSIGANKGSGSSQSITATEQSGIVYSGDNHSLTANKTTNIGGIIANIKTDSDGNQTNGTLNFTTGTLITKDLVNTATQEQKSIGGSLSTGKTATGVSLNNIGLQLGNTGQDFESETRATIGQGAIVTSDASNGKDSLAGVNRDAFNTETITKDMQIGGLDVDTGIDTRVFTSAGRAEIAKEQRELGKNVTTTGKITAAAGVQGVATAGNILSKNQTLSQAIEGLKASAKMAQAIQDNPEIGAVLQGYQQGDYDGLLNSQAALQALADSTGVSVDVIITNITRELRAKGATDGQLVAIDQDPSNRKDAVKTTGHELDHVRGGSSETLANLAGIATDLNVSASMDANQDKID